MTKQPRKITQDPADNSLTIVCSNCRQKSTLSESLIDRPVFGLDDVTEVGIICPYCQYYKRVAWNHPTLDNLRKDIQALAEHLRKPEIGRDIILAKVLSEQYRKQKGIMDQKIDEFQKRTAARLGLKYESPTESLRKSRRKQVADLRPKRLKSDPTDHLIDRPTIIPNARIDP